MAGNQVSLCLPSAAHPPAPAPERPTATVSPLRTPSSPSRLPAATIRPHPTVSPQHGHQPPAPGARPLIPLTSAAAAITPPNVSAAHLNGEVGGGPLGGPASPSPAGKAEERKNEKVRATMEGKRGFSSPAMPQVFCTLRPFPTTLFSCCPLGCKAWGAALLLNFAVSSNDWGPDLTDLEKDIIAGSWTSKPDGQVKSSLPNNVSKVTAGWVTQTH